MAFLPRSIALFCVVLAAGACRTAGESDAKLAGDVQEQVPPFVQGLYGAVDGCATELVATLYRQVFKDSDFTVTKELYWVGFKAHSDVEGVAAAVAHAEYLVYGDKKNKSCQLVFSVPQNTLQLLSGRSDANFLEGVGALDCPRLGPDSGVEWHAPEDWLGLPSLVGTPDQAEPHRYRDVRLAYGLYPYKTQDLPGSGYVDNRAVPMRLRGFREDQVPPNQIVLQIPESGYVSCLAQAVQALQGK